VSWLRELSGEGDPAWSGVLVAAMAAGLLGCIGLGCYTHRTNREDLPPMKWRRRMGENVSTDPRDTIPGPPNGERLCCPIGECRWFLDRPATEFDLRREGDSYVMREFGGPEADVEAAIEVHLEEAHTVEEIRVRLLQVARAQP
jgi:hypothetical protein